MAEIITIDGVIGLEVTIKSVRDQLNKANGKPIEVQISSPGGSVHDGLAIHNLISGYKGEKSTKIIGLAASMASYIALATDKVVAQDNSIFMIHNSRGIVAGDHTELEKYANVFKRTTNLLAEKYSEKTGAPKDEILAMMDKESWFYGKEISENGFATELIESGEVESKEDLAAFAQLQIQEMEARIKEEDKKEDLMKAAALLEPEAQTKTQTPKGEPEMTPEEIKALQDKLAAAEAKLAKQEEAKEEPVEPTPTGVCAQALNVLKSDSYPAQAKDIAAQVLEGNASEDTLKAVVAIIDMQSEKTKSEEAKAEEGSLEATPASMGEDNGIDKEGNITSAKGLYAAGALIKEHTKKGGK